MPESDALPRRRLRDRVCGLKRAGRSQRGDAGPPCPGHTGKTRGRIGPTTAANEATFSKDADRLLDRPGR